MKYVSQPLAHPLARVLFLGMALSGTAGAACAQTHPAIADQSRAHARTPAHPRKIEIVTIPTPLPLPGQLKPIGVTASKPEPRNPRARIGLANAAARIEPNRVSWMNAIQQFPYADGALYQIYLAPGKVTDIALQQGEELVGAGPVAAGDTVRWIIGDTVSGQGASKRVHILVKPTRPDLTTNLVLNTDRRTYHLELRATPKTYMAAVSWTYPHDRLIALRNTNAAAERVAPVSAGIDIASLNFRYRIDGDRAPWRPVRAFDDGRQVYIEFPEDIATGEMPPLFVRGADGGAELVNYRVRGRYMVVDRLFGTAELRLGTKKTERHVTIQRENARRRRGS